ncbi:ECF transporter S component, partial [Listeria monocytogenes]
MKIQKLVLCAMLIAMCVIGANIKLMGSVAFDAA